MGFFCLLGGFFLCFGFFFLGGVRFFPPRGFRKEMLIKLLVGLFCIFSPTALEDEEEEDGHTVVATARGVFNSNGGVLSSIETGVSIIIPQGAIPEGIEQEIYFKVCRDNSILPPLDKEKGNSWHCTLFRYVMRSFSNKNKTEYESNLNMLQ